MIQLIACDIDGTLLRGSQTQIDPEVFRQIHRLKEKGILFCPCSGRQYESMKTLFAPVADDLYIIAENGGAIYDPAGTLLSSNVIPHDLAMAVCHDILDTEGCEVLISCDNMSYLCPKDPFIIEHMRSFVGNNTTIVPTPEDVPVPILKLAAHYKAGSELIEPYFRPRWSDKFNVAKSGKPWVDFTRTDKGEGLTELCRILDIPLSNVMAFGDNYNDLPMLRVAGVPYIMENAVQDLKNQIHNHCSDVAEILKTL